MNWVDGVTVALFVFGLFVGWRMGLIGAIFNVVGIVVGIYIATNFSQLIARWFTEHGAAESIATVLAYVAIIIAIVIGIQLSRNIVKRILSLVLLGWVDTLGAIIVGLLLGGALASVFILGITRFSSDLPTAGAPGAIIEMTGLRGSIQDAVVDSSAVQAFLDITDSLATTTWGPISSDYKETLRQLQRIIEAKT